MPLRTLAAALCLLPVACTGRPVQQTTITQLREQDAYVMAPALPAGVGAPLAAGGGSFSAAAGLTGVQPIDGDVGQQVVPVTGLLRGAAGVDDGVELVATGGLGALDVDPGPLAQRVDGARGVLGRGTLGLRTFVPTRGMVDFGVSFEAGAEASHLTRTDTTTVEIRNRNGVHSDSVGDRAHELRVHPHFRTAMVLRVPLPISAPVTAIGGLQLQTWPVYWGSRTQIDTCTTYRSGTQRCTTTGDVDVAPSPLVAVWTPTAGATLPVAGAHLHVQGFTHLGPTGVDAVPWGAMLTLEARTATRSIRESSLASFADCSERERAQGGLTCSPRRSGGAKRGNGGRAAAPARDR